MSQKLYVIADESPASALRASEPTSSPDWDSSSARSSVDGLIRADNPNRTTPRARTASGSSIAAPPGVASPRAHLRLLAAYLLGPWSVATWTSGRTQRMWLWTGLGCAAAAASLWFGWPLLVGWAESLRSGVVAWLAAVTLLPIAVLAAWSRGVAAVARRHAVRPPHRFRTRAVALMSGVLVPGLGFHVAGHPRRSALAVAALGPLVSAALILSHWRWLWSLGESGALIPGNGLEVIFLAAAGVAAAVAALWIGHAALAARLVPGESPGIRVGWRATALLATAALFAGTGLGAPLAQGLHQASTGLRAEGFRVVPLGLCQAAARLDPAHPVYLLDVATLNDALGRNDQAQSARRALSDQAAGFQAATRLASRSPSDAATRRLAMIGTPSTWSRIQALTE